MGSLNGFWEIKRSDPEKEEKELRIEHFREFVKPLSPGEVQQQSARCMDCGVPFCHSGCPLGNLIPDFNDAVYNNNWELAYQLLASTNNFPEFTGRICPAPCEASCVLGINSDPVAIESLEKQIIEKAFQKGWVRPGKYPSPTGKKVAVIGSGPAGLACADQLSSVGHQVAVFEKSDRFGGLLRYGIPDFKLQKNLIDRRLKILRSQGIRFFSGVHIGVDIPAQELLDQYDVLVLCGGSSVPRELPVPGRTLKGIFPAMDFLEQNNRRVEGDEIPDDSNIEVAGKKVVVIGGGDTGSDCIGTANRLGAESVLQLEILGKPPLSRKPDNPWPQWPMIHRTSSSQEEGCEREWAITTQAFLSENGIDVSGIQTSRIEWAENKLNPIEGTEKVIQADLVFLAMGFLHPDPAGMITQLQLDIDERGNLATNNYQTNHPKVFAAGDMRRGQSLVVWAISEGREAARAVDEYLIQEESALPSNTAGVFHS